MELRRKEIVKMILFLIHEDLNTNRGSRKRNELHQEFSTGDNFIPQGAFGDASDILSFSSLEKEVLLASRGRG